MKSLPNILTGSRLVMALFMFVAFAAAAGALFMKTIAARILRAFGFLFRFIDTSK